MLSHRYMKKGRINAETKESLLSLEWFIIFFELCNVNDTFFLHFSSCSMTFCARFSINMNILMLMLTSQPCEEKRLARKMKKMCCTQKKPERNMYTLHYSFHESFKNICTLKAFRKAHMSQGKSKLGKTIEALFFSCSAIHLHFIHFVMFYI